MANRLPHGRYYITNMENNSVLNAGISRIATPTHPLPPAPVILLPQGALPPRVTLIFCFIYKDPTDLDLPQFTVVPVIGENNTYIITVERRTVGHQGNHVVASENKPAELWLIRYRVDQSAFTVENAEGTLAWTASAVVPGQHRRINLSALAALPTAQQLFNFEHAPSE
ncbi:hypothetical protein F5141DRAFT_1221487 [Pisolithus sp. B1]|nr:hypothetical protein F5141DRAFT_1221487 [Pisolithus sp. B1]